MLVKPYICKSVKEADKNGEESEADFDVVGLIVSNFSKTFATRNLILTLQTTAIKIVPTFVSFPLGCD
jgi:hypothetical protein